VKAVVSLVVFVVLTAAAAAFGAQFAPGEWYAALDKPSWNPPNWLFGPVWTVLYLAIAVAGWRVWRKAPGKLSPALGLWIAQLLLNAAWSWAFFGLHEMGWALAEILLLLATITSFIVVARPVDRLASWLFVPYGLWVSFATVLNFTLWRLNV
jgi:tryptophan-rich sensory protein